LSAIVVLLVAAFAWRLTRGPLALDFLGPYVADAIASAQPGLVARIDHTLVSLEQGGTVDIVARGVRLRRSDGDAQLTLPELSLGLSLRAALTGVVAPTRIVLRQPELRLERGTDGAFRIGFGEDEPDAGDWTENLLHDLAAPPDRHGPLGYLAQVAVRDAGLTVVDRALGVTWRAKRADASMFRTDGGIFGDMALTVERAGGGETQLRSDFRYVGGRDRGERRRLGLFKIGEEFLHPRREMRLEQRAIRSAWSRQSPAHEPSHDLAKDRGMVFGLCAARRSLEAEPG
jgi:hypothetical protein